ncbi:MAG: methyltransferase domain-containing protein [bacterium]|nr:methyltransferase domain-containing protein [bacterium]
MHESYFESYADPAVHRTMIGDHARTDAFRRGVEDAVRPGDVVLDLGTGTGILSLFAARAGARRVFAIDNSSMINTAKRIAKRNGFEDRIEFIRGHAEKVQLGEKVDVILSEWMGYFALAECMFRSVVILRDQWLKPEGRIVPSRLRLYLAPIEDPVVHAYLGVGLWERPVYGFDYSDMVEHELSHLITATEPLRTEALLGPASLLTDVDCSTAPISAFFFETTVALEIERSGTVHGLGGWFEVDLGPNVVLSAAPDALRTHWRQSFFPVRPFPVQAGDVLRIAMRAREPDTGDRRLPTYFMDGQLERGDEAVHTFFYCHHGTFE